MWRFEKMQGPDTDVNSLISKSPIQTSQRISGIPVIYSKITLMTKDRYWFPYHPDITLFHEDVPDY